MKIFNINTLITGLFCTVLFLSACNKDVPDPVPIPRPQPGTGETIGDIITKDTTFSYLLAAVNRVGISDPLFTNTYSLTLWAPNNTVFRAFLTQLGLPPAIASINLIPLTTLTPLMQYHAVGYKLGSADIPETFPNKWEHSMFALPGAPAPFVRMPVFTSKRGTTLWANNVPVIKSDVSASNGVIHAIGGILAPPSQTLSAIIKADTSLSFLRAAIVRADSGQVGMGRLDSVMNLAYGPNLTVYAPNNNAFRALLVGMGFPPAEAVIGMLPVQTVRAIVSYHGLGVRVFSPNFPATATPVPTLLTQAVPGTTVSISTAGVKGLANPTISNILTANRNATNGVIHVIDQVLRFQ